MYQRRKKSDAVEYLNNLVQRPELQSIDIQRVIVCS
jgi:hypothetical protein